MRAGLELSRGAARIFDELHRLACDVARERGYCVLPDAVTFHVPALMVAALVGYTDRHLRTLTRELEAVGLVDAGGHASRVGLRSLYDGTVWSVKVKPGDVAAKVRPDEWRHNWRPTFATDVEGKRGAARLISELRTEEANEDEIYRAVLRAAVSPGEAFAPLSSSSEMGDGERLDDVRDVVYRLGELPAVHARKRAELVGRMASALARAFGDRHSRRWYAALIWRAWGEHLEGRAGLQALGGQLLRLDDERRSWTELRSPGALLASRLAATA